MPYEPVAFNETPAWTLAEHTRAVQVGGWVCATQPSALDAGRRTYLTCITSLSAAPPFQLGFQHDDERLSAVLFSERLTRTGGRCEIEYSLDNEPCQTLWGTCLGASRRIGLGRENSIILARDLIGRQRLGVRVHLSAFDRLDSVYDVRGFSDAHAPALRRFVLAPSYISPARRYGFLM